MGVEEMVTNIELDVHGSLWKVCLREAANICEETHFFFPSSAGLNGNDSIEKGRTRPQIRGMDVRPQRNIFCILPFFSSSTKLLYDVTGDERCGAGNWQTSDSSIYFLS